MGGRVSTLNDLAKQVWLWCIERNIWVSAFHIPGKLNIRADQLSRQMLHTDMEWSLDKEVFEQIMVAFGRCDVDLFASKRNHKIAKYVSYTPDSQSIAVNAFSLTWNKFYAYMFPPFSLVGSVLQKLQVDQAEGVLVAPLFSTQMWFPRILHMAVAPPKLLPPVSKILKHPEGQQHKLQKMTLCAFKVSGKNCAVKDFQKTLPTLSCHPGEKELKNNMGVISKSGCYFVVKVRLIHFSHLYIL